MSRLDAGKVLNLLAAKRSDSRQGNEIAKLVRNICEAELKLENPEQQNFYFRKGILNLKSSLDKWKKEFIKIRLSFNEATIDELINQRNLYENQLQLIKANKEGRALFIKHLHINHIVNDINLLDDMLELKIKTDKLQNISYYLKNKGALQIFYEL